MSVVTWRSLADNVGASIRKGDPVVVSGRLRVREWQSNGRQGTDVEIDATAIGHDLTRGVATFQRVKRQPRSHAPDGADAAPAALAVDQGFVGANREPQSGGGARADGDSEAA